MFASTNPFLNWRFILYYTSNLNYTNTDKWSCLGDGTVEEIDWDSLQVWAYAPTVGDTTLTVFPNK